MSDWIFTKYACDIFSLYINGRKARELQQKPRQLLMIASEDIYFFRFEY